jgi:hypothetical protein
MPERLRAGLMPILVILAGCTLGVPLATEPAEITPRASPSPTPSATAAATAAAIPSPSPTPAPDPATMTLEAVSCNGGVLLDWSPSTHTRFHHYTALRSPDRHVSAQWPPIAPAVDWGRTYTIDRFETAAVDASIFPSDTLWYYRVIAYNVRDRPVATSPVRAARIRQPRGLGSLDIGAGEDGAIRLSWRVYGGDPRCFGAYRILAASGGAPLDTLTIVSDRTVDSVETDALTPGTTYQLQVQAVRTTTLGSFILGETDSVMFTVP